MTLMELAVEKGLLTQLLAHDVVNALTTGSVFNLLAIKPTPYVLFSQNAGGERNEQERREGDLRYLVKGVASEQDGGAGVAGQIAEAIDSALHGQKFSIDLPWKVYACQRTAIVKYHESVEKRNFYHHGAIYRIRVSEVLP